MYDCTKKKTLASATLCNIHRRKEEKEENEKRKRERDSERKTNSVIFYEKVCSKMEKQLYEEKKNIIYFHVLLTASSCSIIMEWNEEKKNRSKIKTEYDFIERISL